jgi:uncharacterized SAM-dependent methyltransferase
MNLNALKIVPDIAPEIVKKINRKDLYTFYKKHLSSGYMHPAQWFADAVKWYQIHTFNNPYNIGRPNAELALLLEYKERVLEYIKDMPLVFWGVGNSDTEMEIINFQIEKFKDTAYITAIDINHRFLKDFANALIDKVKEDPVLDIYFFGLNCLFEEVSFQELDQFVSKNKMHICLGNTIGNYEHLADMVEIFQRTMVKGDYLLLGFQSDRLAESTARRYFGNQYLESLFMSALYPKFQDMVKGRTIKWKYEENKQQIEAWIDDIQVFRSKKFKPEKLEDCLMKYGFASRCQLKDRYTTCLYIFEHLGKEYIDVHS